VPGARLDARARRPRRGGVRLEGVAGQVPLLRLRRRYPALTELRLSRGMVGRGHVG
jgi:hypothetical protein